MIEIKRWDTGQVIHSGKFESIKECLEDGVSKGVNFWRAELNGVNLNGAKLNSAKLNGAKLSCANFVGAELSCAELSYANLNSAELSGAELSCADFAGAELPHLSVCIHAGERYWLFLSPQVVVAGCKSYSPEEWRKFSKKEIAEMDGKAALKFYPRLLDLMDFFLGEGERPEWAFKGNAK